MKTKNTFLFPLMIYQKLKQNNNQEAVQFTVPLFCKKYKFYLKLYIICDKIIVVKYF